MNTNGVKHYLMYNLISSVTFILDQPYYIDTDALSPLWDLTSNINIFHTESVDCLVIGISGFSVSVCSPYNNKLAINV